MSVLPALPSFADGNSVLWARGGDVRWREGRLHYWKLGVHAVCLESTGNPEQRAGVPPFFTWHFAYVQSGMATRSPEPWLPFWSCA